jgi:hypothetical protein
MAFFQNNLHPARIRTLFEKNPSQPVTVSNPSQAGTGGVGTLFASRAAGKTIARSAQL